MKVYVTNGFNKQVFNAPNYKMAVQAHLKYLIMNGTTKEGDELFELAPLTWVSNCGFMNDLLEMGMTKEYDQCQCVDTQAMFSQMGRNDISKWMKGRENKENKAVKDMLKALRE